MPRPLLHRTREGSLSVVYRGKYLYSRFSPLEGVRRHLEKKRYQKRTLYLVPSPLLGYGLEEVLTSLPHSSFLLAVEVEETLMRLSLDRLPRRVFDHPLLVLVRTREGKEIAPLLDKQGLWRFRHVVFLPLNGGYLLNKEAYDRLLRFLDDYVRTYWRNRMTQIHLGDLWIRNLFANLPHLSRACPPASLNTENKPVVVTGAGPSLERILSLLARERRHIYLLTVDTALPTLRAAGLLPDGVVNVESQMENLRDFYGETTCSWSLIADLTACRASLRLPKAISFVPILSRFGKTLLLERLEGKGLLPLVIPPLGSVGLVAVEMALAITTKEVFLTGLDFAYQKGKTHAVETEPYRKYFLHTHNRLRSLSTWYHASCQRPLERIEGTNPPLFTDRVLSSYAEQLKERLAFCSERVFDLRGGQGVPLGIASLCEDAFADKLHARAEPSPPALWEGKRPPSPEKIRAFLLQERAYLKQALLSGKTYSQGEKSALEGLKRALAQVDYVYFSFSDEPPLPREDPSFLARAILSTGRHLKRLEHIPLLREEGTSSSSTPPHPA